MNSGVPGNRRQTGGERESTTHGRGTRPEGPERKASAGRNGSARAETSPRPRGWRSADGGFKNPEKDGSRIMGDGPPCLDGLRIAAFPGFGNVRTVGGKFRHAFSGVRQGGKAVYTALLHCDVVRAQITFLIGPDPDAPDSSQQDGFPVQGPPVSEDMEVRHLFLIHTLAPSYCFSSPQLSPVR